MGQIISLHLEGPEAEFGRIPASDVARLFNGWERALGRAAEARMRRQARTGRRPGAVERSTRLIFRDIQRGSLVAVLEIPDVRDGEVSEDGAFDLDDAHLGELASDDAIALLLDPERADADEGLIEAMLQLSSELGIGTRYDALEISVDRDETAAPSQPRTAALTSERREQLSRRREALRQRAEDGTVVGTLVEADFERHTARVLTSDQRGVAVTFTEDQADEIQNWLRRPGELEGHLRFDPRSGIATGVDLVRIIRTQQLQAIIDVDDFGRHVSVEQLAAEQGVRGVLNVDSLVDDDASDDEVDAFLAALGQ